MYSEQIEDEQDFKVLLINDEFFPLDMDKTLEQNNVPDESEKFSSIGIDEDYYIPTLHIYFNDDLTYAQCFIVK